MIITGYSEKYKGVEHLPYKEPKNQIYKHTIYSHSRKGIISPSGNKPRTRMSSVYNKTWSDYKTKDIENHISGINK
jgi:hypothetical protein